jgi:hypothetical protein
MLKFFVAFGARCGSKNQQGLHLVGVEKGLAVQVHEPSLWMLETLLVGAFNTDVVVARESQPRALQRSALSQRQPATGLVIRHSVMRQTK